MGTFLQVRLRVGFRRPPVRGGGVGLPMVFPCHVEIISGGNICDGSEDTR